MVLLRYPFSMPPFRPQNQMSATAMTRTAVPPIAIPAMAPPESPPPELLELDPGELVDVAAAELVVVGVLVVEEEASAGNGSPGDNWNFTSCRASFWTSRV